MPQMLLGPRSSARPKAGARGRATGRTHWCLLQNSSLGNWGNWEGPRGCCEHKRVQVERGRFIGVAEMLSWRGLWLLE